jgi:hypothetical protein
MEPDFLAQLDSQPVSTRALGTSAGVRGLDRLAPCCTLVRQDSLHRNFQAGGFAQRWLLDFGRSGPVSRTSMCRKNPIARLAHRSDVGAQIPQEDCLGDD